jgi:hypothetical protein
MSVRTQSAIVGACVFGTSDGFTVRGLGCLAAETPELRRELDMQSYKVEREEAFWFCLPVWVDKVEARLIGKTNYAMDLSHRHGNAGAAVVTPVSSFAKAGFSGAMRYAEDLHERFLRTCLDARSQVLSFQRAAEALRPLVFLQPSSARLSFVGKRPQRLKLPHSWPAYVSMPELFRLAMSAEALKPADINGFVLREVDSAQADIRIEEALLASWYDALYGSDQSERLERERDEARSAWRSEQIRRTDLERTVAANETRLQGALQTVDSLKASERDLQKQMEASAAQLHGAKATINSMKGAQTRFEAEYRSRIDDWERAYNKEKSRALQLKEELRKIRREEPRPPWPWRVILMAFGFGLVLGIPATIYVTKGIPSSSTEISTPQRLPCGLGRDLRDRLLDLEVGCSGSSGYDDKYCNEHERQLESTRKKLLNCNAPRRCLEQQAALKSAKDPKDRSARMFAIYGLLDCLRID